MRTHRQLHANRTNSLRSTGPISPAGKLAVSKNATKYGLWTREIVLPGESHDDWQAFRAGLFQTLGPVGTAEEALAEQICEILWRQRRIAVVETAIAHMAPPPADRADNSMNNHSNPPKQVSPGKNLDSLLRKLADAQKDQQECQWFLDFLSELPHRDDQEVIEGTVAEMIYERFDLYSEEGFGVLHFGHSNRKILESISLPEEFRNSMARWPDWTIAKIRMVLQCFAASQTMSFEELCHQARQGYTGRLAALAKCEQSLQSEISQLQINENTKLLNSHLQRLYLQGDKLERLHRAEAHLARMLRQKLLLYLELQSFRHSRAESEDIVEPCIVTLREPAIRNRLKPGRRQLLRSSESQSFPVG